MWRTQHKGGLWHGEDNKSSMQITTSIDDGFKDQAEELQLEKQVRSLSKQPQPEALAEKEKALIKGYQQCLPKNFRPSND